MRSTKTKHVWCREAPKIPPRPEIGWRLCGNYASNGVPHYAGLGTPPVPTLLRDRLRWVAIAILVLSVGATWIDRNKAQRVLEAMTRATHRVLGECLVMTLLPVSTMLASFSIAMD
jgi:hypothetical protein